MGVEEAGISPVNLLIECNSPAMVGLLYFVCPAWQKGFSCTIELSPRTVGDPISSIQFDFVTIHETPLIFGGLEIEFSKHKTMYHVAYIISGIVHRQWAW
jgi:hypothetical protein